MNTKHMAALILLAGTICTTRANILTGTDYFVNMADTGVGYNYNMGKYEITQGQWSSFTTSVGAQNLYGHSGDIGNAYGGPYTWGTDQPAAQMSWYEAAQFCNWLTSGNIADGAYLFDNANNFLGVNRTAAETLPSVYVIPSYDEWMAAAFYNGTQFTTYANGSDTTPPMGWNFDANTYAGGGGNPLGLDANIQAPEYPNSIFEPWVVGSGSAEQNGTYDMTGNVWEWTEEADLIGGSAHDDNHIASSNPLFPFAWDADDESSWLGFRVVEIGTSVIPEPASLAMLALVGTGAWVVRRWFFI